VTIKFARVKDLRLLLRRGAPVRRSSVELRAQPAKAARLCLSALKQPMLAMPSLEVNRDRIE